MDHYQTLAGSVGSSEMRDLIRNMRRCSTGIALAYWNRIHKIHRKEERRLKALLNSVPDSLEKRIKTLCSLDAIKLLRDEMGCGLREAKWCYEYLVESKLPWWEYP